MCRKLVVTNEIFLGARPICYEAYSLPKGEVVELTEKQIKDTLKGLTTDEVYGLRLSEAGELELDTDGFFTTNMMKKVHTNTLVPMVRTLLDMHIISAGAKMQGDNVIVAPLEKLEQSRPQQPTDTKIEKTTATKNETK